MDHVRFNAENRQDDECKVVINRDNNAFARTTGIFTGRTTAVICAKGISHLWRGENEARRTGTDDDL